MTLSAGVLDELEHAVEEAGGLVHLAVVPKVVLGPGYPKIEWVEVRCCVVADFPVPPADAEHRQSLYRKAERIIQAVEERGWSHCRAPQIELCGDGYWERGELVILHKCELRLEVLR